MKYKLRNHILAHILSIYAAEKMALAILLRFNAIADSRYFSVAARMPHFRSFKRLHSIFIPAKLQPGFPPFSSWTGISEYWSLNVLYKTQGSNYWPEFFCAHRSHQNKSRVKRISGRHPPASGNSEGISPWTDCSLIGDIPGTAPPGK